MNTVKGSIGISNEKVVSSDSHPVYHKTNSPSPWLAGLLVRWPQLFRWEIWRHPASRIRECKLLRRKLCPGPQPQRLWDEWSGQSLLKSVSDQFRVPRPDWQSYPLPCCRRRWWLYLWQYLFCIWYIVVAQRVIKSAGPLRLLALTDTLEFIDGIITACY